MVTFVLGINLGATKLLIHFSLINSTFIILNGGSSNNELRENIEYPKLMNRWVKK